ncbi:MAG: hypothetical protein M3Z54_11170 [Gemmatimonadota bacterium]|nr:hypothetical protein [Gemmatimonadota bacterium]
MFTQSILPDEIVIPLDAAGFKGVAAVARPLDVIDASKWRDAFPTEAGRNIAATELVRAQLIRIEGMVMKAADGSTVSYDHTNPKHFRSIGVAMRNAIYNGLMERASVSEEQEKNSDSPSVSGGTSGTESSPAAAAASEPATS